MAQVTVSGKLQFDYGSQTTVAGVKTTQGQMGGGDLRVTAVEDLGGGIKATARAEFSNRGRGHNPGGRDASINLTGGFGSITAGAVEAGNGIVGLGQGGAPTIGLDGAVLDGGTNVGIISYGLPSMVSGLGLSVSTMNLVGNATAANNNREALTINQLAATYTAGPLSIAVDRADFTKQIGAGTVDDRTRFSVGYNLGVARIGYGHQVKTFNTAGERDNVQTVMGVSVPLGAITLGVASASNKTDGAATKITGTEYGASYALSKRTSLSAAARSYKTTGLKSDKATRVRLSHSF